MTETTASAPKISVILPNYNHGEYLRQSIESVLSQTYRDFEFIIVDDGSTDDSWAIIKEYADKDPRIVAEKFPENRGVTAAFTRCCELCRGEFLFGRASDDYLINEFFFERAMSAMELHPNAAGVFVGCKLMRGDTGEVYGDMGYRMGFQGKTRFVESSFTFLSKEQAQEEFLAYRLFIPGASAIWKIDLLDQVGGIDTALGPQSDYFLNHALPMLCGVVQIHDFAVAVRVFPNSYSSGVEDDTFFKRHALVEKKTRRLIKDVAQDERGWLAWRTALIKAHIPDQDNALNPSPKGPNSKALVFARRCYSYVMRRLRAIAKAVVMNNKTAENQLQRRRQRAHAIFEKVVRGDDIL